MTEAYTQSLAVAGDGSVRARHGSVSSISVLDGYTVEQIPEPRQAPEVNWLLIARVHANRLGDAWTVEDRVLKQWVGGRWVSHGAPAGWATPMRGAVPMGEDRIWVLFEGQLAEYRPASKSWRVLRESSAARIGSFTNMLRGAGGDLWIGGDHGALYLNTGSLEGPALGEVDVEGLGLHRVRRLLTRERGVLFFMAIDKAGASVAGRWSAGAGLQIVGRSPHLVHLWSSSEELAAGAQ